MSNNIKKDSADILSTLGNAQFNESKVTNYPPTIDVQTAAAHQQATKEEPLTDEAKQMQLEILKLEKEAKELEILERRANLEDVAERIADRKNTRETRMQRSRTNGQTILQIENEHRQVQKRCNHKKGGQGAQGVVGGKGDDNQYAVLKHTFANGDTWVRCLRCGKTWKPVPEPVEPQEEDYDIPANYSTAVKEYSKLMGLFNRINTEYHTALEFTTRNIPSGSVAFKWSDGGEYYRRVTENVNLR